MLFHSSLKDAVSLKYCKRLFSHLNSTECVLERLEGKHKHVTVMHLQREKAKNALGSQFMAEFRASMQALREDTETRVLIINSKVNGVFCAGADLKERAGMNETETVNCVKILRSAFTELENLPVPTIAAINGVAFGGGLEMALAADMRVAVPDAKLGLVETSLAIIPGAGGTQRLPRLVGLSKAKELILLSERFTAEEASKFNLVTALAEPGQTAYSKSLELAQKLLTKGPVALKMAKFAINKGSQVSMDAGLAIEEACYAQVVPTADRLEGLASFREKRAPIYKAC